MHKKTLTALVFFSLFFTKPLWAAEEDSLRVLLAQVPAQYVQPITSAQTAVYFLKSIGQLDKNLRVGNDDDKISLYYRGRLVKSLYKPESDNDVAAWADLCGEVLDLTYQSSREAQTNDFKAFDLIMNSFVANLDKDSKYYPGLKENAGRAPHHPNFGARMEGDNLFLKIGAFNNFSKDEIVKAIGEYPEAKGLILDLRNSPGGQLSAAVEIVDLFLDEGIVVSVQGRNENEATYYTSKDGDVTNGLPMVVLVDGNTASAAEVLAASLQEQSRAKVVGTKTFGKGTIQNLIHFPQGGVLSLSSSYFFTPSGQKLAQNAVVPDVCVYEMPDHKDIFKLIAAGKEANCGQESREDRLLEEEIAAELLKI